MSVDTPADSVSRIDYEKAISAAAEWARKYESLRALNAELIEVVEGLLEQMAGRNVDWFNAYMDRTRHRARAILAKAKTGEGK